MAVGEAGDEPVAAAAAAAQPRYLGVQTGLVDEDQPLGVEVELALEPRPAPSQDVRPILLAGVRGLLWNGPLLLRRLG